MITYYEEIACDLTGAKIHLLFEKTKGDSIAFARQLCMAYRLDVLKMKSGAAGERYNRDHATVLHARRCISNYIETKDDRAKIYHEFIKRCKVKVSDIKSQEDFDDIETSVNNELNQHGFQQFVNTTQTLFYTLLTVVRENDDEPQIRHLLDKCHRKIHELKYLYE